MRGTWIVKNGRISSYKSGIGGVRKPRKKLVKLITVEEVCTKSLRKKLREYRGEHIAVFTDDGTLAYGTLSIIDNGTIQLVGAEKTVGFGSSILSINFNRLYISICKINEFGVVSETSTDFKRSINSRDGKYKDDED